MEESFSFVDTLNNPPPEQKCVVPILLLCTALGKAPVFCKKSAVCKIVHKNQKCALNSVFNQGRQAFFQMHNSVGTIILKKKALPRAFFFTTKMCIFFDKKTLAILIQKIATKKCPPLDFVKKTKRGQAGDDTFLSTHNFAEIDCLQICATKKCLKSTLCFFSFF